MSSAYLAQLCVECFGVDFFTDAAVSAKFVRPVYAGDELQVTGVVRDVVPHPGRVRATVDMWCEDQAGTAVTVGTAEHWVSE